MLEWGVGRRLQYWTVLTYSHTHSYVDKIDVVKLKDYVPSVQDVLRSRVRTSGILDEHYVIDKVDFV